MPYFTELKKEVAARKCVSPIHIVMSKFSQTSSKFSEISGDIGFAVAIVNVGR